MKAKNEEKRQEIAEKDEKIKKNDKKKAILRSTFVIFVLFAVCVLFYLILVWTGVWEDINSVDKIRQLILSLGFWGRFVFVMIQFLQVTFIPIPSTVSTLAGVLIYGPLQASLLSFAGILLGSVVAFWLGRFFGRKLVVFMVGKEMCDKWAKFLTEAKYSFFVMMLLPMFPDDVLCLVAGLTDMSWGFFIGTNVICRPVGILLTCYLGSGSIIPYYGWGLAVWALLVAFVIVLIYLSYRYRDKIENFLMSKFSSKKTKQKTDKTDENQEKTTKKIIKNVKETDKMINGGRKCRK